MDVFRDPRAQLIAGLLLITVLSVFLVRRIIRRITQRLHREAPDGDQHLLADLLRAVIGPVTVLAWYYALYAIARVLVGTSVVPEHWTWVQPLVDQLASVGVFIALLWFFFNATGVADRRLRRAGARTESKLDDVLLPLLGTALRVTVPILAIFVLIQLWPLSPSALGLVRKLIAVALIVAITWTLRRAVLLVDAAVLGSGALAGTATLHERALFTRVRMLRRVALVLIGVFALAATLMLFDEVRDVGRSILASAGIAGIVIGFAAQRSLGNLFAGIQIAVTQPVRLGDQVLVEGDVGNVEEITLTYVVVRVWDQRRLVLPISYFIEKPFQNWTRVTTNMLSPLAIRVDFSLPIDELRAYLQREIAKSQFWDKKVFGVQVTNSDHRSMEVRILASAPDAGASFNLQCELREKAIDFIRRNHPDCLPKLRQENRQIDAWQPFNDGDRADHPLARAKRNENG